MSKLYFVNISSGIEPGMTDGPFDSEQTLLKHVHSMDIDLDSDLPCVITIDDNGFPHLSAIPRDQCVELEECDDCGAMVPEIISCPDGAEICQSCFDAGGH